MWAWYHGPATGTSTNPLPCSNYFNSKPLYNDGRKVTFLLNNKEVTREDSSLYLTQAITNFALDALEAHKNKSNPFFLYVDYNAPHWPIQALPEDIARYKGKYLAGWDTLRQRRYEKLIATGLIKKEWLLSHKLVKIPAWNTLPDAEKDRLTLLFIHRTPGSKGIMNRRRKHHLYGSTVSCLIITADFFL